MIPDSGRRPTMISHAEASSLTADDHDHASPVAHHFDSASQQFEAGKLGMWLFLVSEVLFFSGLFVAYAIYRHRHIEVFVAGSELLDVSLGAFNTVVLLFSSLTMALAVRSAQLSDQRRLVIWLSITIACAVFFLGVKGVEYSHKVHDGLLWQGAISAEPGTEINGVAAEELGTFFSIYFAMTGLHALHIIGGIGVLIWLLVRATRGHFSSTNFAAVDYAGLYWHLVDLVWIYLFPLLYLI